MAKFSDVIIFNEKGQILFLRRTWDNDLEPNKLGFPGGHVDSGEKPIDAAKRELKEETGLVVNSIYPITSRKVEKGEIHYFVAHMDNGFCEIPFITLDNSEHYNYTFKDFNEIEECGDEEFIFDLRKYILEELKSKIC